MPKRNSEERKAMLAARRKEQLSRVPTVPFKMTGKYIPAGPDKNIKPHNR